MNSTQHLNKTTICSKRTIAQKLKFLDNVTSLSGHKVSFMLAKMTSNTLQCLQNE